MTAYTAAGRIDNNPALIVQLVCSAKLGRLIHFRMHASLKPEEDRLALTHILLSLAWLWGGCF